MALEGQKAKDGGNFRKVEFALQRPFTWPSSSPAALVLGEKREVKAIEGLPKPLETPLSFRVGFTGVGTYHIFG